MFIPFACDAPIYHRPWATWGLIAVNVLVWIAWVGGWISDPAYETWWILEYGRFTPVQWLTSAFAHADIVHLLGNMVFLWTFGLVAEGKLGWKVYLPLYLGLCVVPSMLEQLLMLGASGGSLGASTAISGLIVLALAWAPRNRVDVVVWIAWIIRHVEVPVWGVALFFIGWDFLSALLVGFSMSTPVLHLLGVLVGAPVAYLFLKRDWVDCEGWDLLTILRHGQPQNRVAKAVVEDLAERKAIERRECREAQAAAESLAAGYLTEGDLDAAILVLESAEREHGAWTPAVALLRDLVQALWRAERYAEFEGWAERLAAASPGAAVPVRIAQAKLLIEHRDRPAKGRQVLAALDPAGLDAAQRRQVERLMDRAQERIDAGVLEILD